MPTRKSSRVSPAPAAAIRLHTLCQHLTPGGLLRASWGGCAAGRREAGPSICLAAALEDDTLAERSRQALERLEAALARPEPPPPREGPFKKQKQNQKKGPPAFSADVSLADAIPMLQDMTEGLEYNVAEHLPGPLRDPARTRDEVLLDCERALGAGANHLMWMDMQRRYCADGMSSNFVIPIIGVSPAEPPVRTQQIILAHPEDGRRIAGEHILKQPNFSASLLGTSVISTTDNEHWRRMRESLLEAVLPMASLAKIYPTVVARAAHCADRLAGLSKGGRAVDISNFLLHEALAQLMLGLFGFPEHFIDATNQRFRDAMNGKADSLRFTRCYMEALLDLMKHPAHTAPSEALATGCPLHGPLSRIIDTTTPDGDTLTKIGNAFIFAFAGHDTTGHTMTWFVFEMAQQPELQARLQREVDDFFERLGGRPMEYGDLASLPFMTRCIMETLRLWPSVPNGTFRELQHDDWVHGPRGKRVHVPKGTYVQIASWLFHRNQDLWGPDVDIFNPDREFCGAELWDDKGFASYNPASERFSPFTHRPRDCLGKNFAQSEMRAILAHLFHRFDFALAQPEHGPAQQGVNYGTMGPRDFTRPAPKDPTFARRVPVGLLVRVTPRH